jgi:hypothetical protein
VHFETILDRRRLSFARAAIGLRRDLEWIREQTTWRTHREMEARDRPEPLLLRGVDIDAAKA